MSSLRSPVNTTSVSILRQGHQSSILRSTRPYLAALLGSYVCMRFHSHLMEKKRTILRGTCSGVIHNVDSSNRTQGEQNQPPCATNHLASAHQPFLHAMHRCLYLAWHGPTTRKKLSVECCVQNPARFGNGHKWVAPADRKNEKWNPAWNVR